MSTSRSAGWHRLVSRAANAGSVLGGVSLVAGLFIIMTPVANRAPSDDSPSSIAAITLVCLGMAVTMASTGLWVGQALTAAKAAGHCGVRSRPARRPWSEM